MEATPQVTPPAQPTTPPAEAPKPEALSPKFGALAKKEAELLKRSREFSATEQRLKALEEALGSREGKLKEFEALKSDPMKALDWLGTDYSKLTEMMLAGGKKTPEMVAAEIADQKIAAWRKEQEEAQAKSREESEKRGEEERKKAEEQRVSDYVEHLTQQLEANKSKYPIAHQLKKAHDVYSVIDEHYRRSLAKAQETNPDATAGEIMEWEKGAELVEAHWKKQTQQEVEALLPYLDLNAITQVLSRARGQTAPQLLKTKIEAAKTQDWAEKPKSLSSSVQPTTAGVPSDVMGSTRFRDEDAHTRAVIARWQARKAQGG